MELEYLPGGHPHPHNIINSNSDTIVAEFSSVRTAIYDTGWIKIGFTAGVSSSDCYIRRIGSIVYFKGWIVSPAVTYDIWTIPEEFRPLFDVVIVVLKDDVAVSKANMQFNANGVMRINHNTNEATRINMGGLSYAI